MHRGFPSWSETPERDRIGREENACSTRSPLPINLTAAGIEPQQAKAIVAVVRSSEESAVTRTELEAALAQLETGLYRALLVQTLTIGGLVVALPKLL